MFLMLIEEGHSHGEGCRVLTDDQGFPTGIHELLELSLEVESWKFLTSK